MPTIKPRFSITMDKKTYEMVEEYKFRGRFKNQTQAVLDLIGKGIDGLIEDGIIPRTATENPIIEKYNALDAHGRKVVDFILDEEYARAATVKQVKNEEPEQPEPKKITKIVYTDPAAAGVPMYAESAYEHIDFLESEVPSEADFGIRISGDSMEPTIADGSIVWVRKTPEVQIGRIGVFMIDDSAVCKRFYADEDGIRLESDNEKYPPIVVREYEYFGIVGRVLGYR